MKQQRWIQRIQTILICAPCTLFACALETEATTTALNAGEEAEVAEAELPFVALDAKRAPNPVIFEKSRIPARRPRAVRPMP